MRIGCVKEIKNHEYRVGLTPDNVSEYMRHGHTVYIETKAGEGSSFTDKEYASTGAIIMNTAKEVWDTCDMIVKVKEPLPEEYALMKKGQILFTYLHLAASKELLDVLLAKQVKGVAYETIEDTGKGLPCLKPMSEIAGRLSIQEGAKHLEKPFGGRGVLLGGVPGVTKGRIVILGGGTVGLNACKMAVGLDAQVALLDLNLERLRYVDDMFGGKVETLYSNRANIERSLSAADLVVGAVLIPGGSAPKLIRREYLQNMKKGAVIVDVAVDQGGCSETTHPTCHDDPTFVVDGVVNYCVANMPGSVPVTSTVALVNATLPFGLLIADNGLDKACRINEGLLQGVNTYNGACTYRRVAESFNIDYVPLTKAV